jgi:hypothetical protein
VEAAPPRRESSQASLHWAQCASTPSLSPWPAKQVFLDSTAWQLLASLQSPCENHRRALNLFAVLARRFTAKHAFCWMQLSLVDRCPPRRLQSVEASGTLRTQPCIWSTRDVAGCIQSPAAPHSHVVHRTPGTVRQPGSNNGIRCRVGLSEVNGVRVPQLSHVSQTGLGSRVRYLMNQISALQSKVFCCRDLCCSMRSTTVITSYCK